jgi:hypothetical protein
MTTTVRPMFMDSPYFVADVDNWYIKDDAPIEIKKEFEEYEKEYNNSATVKAMGG